MQKKLRHAVDFAALKFSFSFMKYDFTYTWTILPTNKNETPIDRHKRLPSLERKYMKISALSTLVKAAQVKSK